MSEIPTGQHCGKCGAALSLYAPDGLCAACLLESAFEQRRAEADEQPRPTPLLAFNDYELLEEIARGGMGVVYRARQISLNRIVAIKMILGGHLANAAEMQRFRAEAETAAQLQHSNIVAIHEVGEHAGQPFFSMDLIAGRNLAQLVRDAPLLSRKAAGYLKTIADAVQYAHSRGVLHRDLKPSNILIDDSDQPRITDFGLAKRFGVPPSGGSGGGQTGAALKSEPAEAGTPNHLTQTGQVLGSPSFIPPEQAAGLKDLIGPASDVYSLGAILYHCLTARPPFVAESMTATLRMVAENEPVSPRLLNVNVPRDLETICLKCLEKDPKRRYPTGQHLADELGRFLSGEPIRARPASLAEKLWRWSRRKPALATVIFLVLIAAVASPIAAFLINRERRQAQTESRKSQQVAQFLKDMIEGVGPSVARGRDTVLLREILDKTKERVGKQLKGQPAVEAELRTTLGDIYELLSEYDNAELMHQKALAIRQALFGSPHPDVAASLANVGSVLVRRGELSKAEGMLRESLAMRQKLLGNRHHDVAKAWYLLGMALFEETKLDEAEEALREAVAIHRAAVIGHKDELVAMIGFLGVVLTQERKLEEAESLLREAVARGKEIWSDEDPFLAIALRNLGDVLLEQERPGDAEKLYRDALLIQRKALSQEHQELARTLNNLGGTLEIQTRLVEAEAVEREALPIMRKVLGATHPDLAALLANLASVLRRQGKLVEAETMLCESLAISRKVFGKDSLRIAALLDSLSELCIDEGKLGEAEAASSEALTIYRKALGPENRGLWRPLHFLAQALMQQGKLAEAEAEEREALIIVGKFSGKESSETSAVGLVLHHLADILHLRKALLPEARSLAEEAVGEYQRHSDWPANEREHATYVLASVLMALGDFPAATAICREQVARLRALDVSGVPASGDPNNLLTMGPFVVRNSSPDKPFLDVALNQLAMALLGERKFVEAELPARDSLVIREKRPDDWHAFITRSVLGACLLGQQRYAEAEPLLLAAYEGLKQREAQIPLPLKSSFADAIHRLVLLYEAMGSAEKADLWRQREIATGEASAETEGGLRTNHE